MKQKNDKEFELRDMHLKKQETLKQMEANLCINRLEEIKQKLNKTNQKARESYDQKI